MSIFTHKNPVLQQGITLQNRFYHYRKWCKADVWKFCWIQLLSNNKAKLDLSSSTLDGSHTTALKGGKDVVYQGKNK